MTLIKIRSVVAGSSELLKNNRSHNDSGSTQTPDISSLLGVIDLKGLIRGTADKLKDSRVHCSADTCRDVMGGIKGQTGVLGQMSNSCRVKKNCRPAHSDSYSEK